MFDEHQSHVDFLRRRFTRGAYIYRIDITRSTFHWELFKYPANQYPLMKLRVTAKQGSQIGFGFDLFSDLMSGAGDNKDNRLQQAGVVRKYVSVN